MRNFKSFLEEKTLTPAEKKKREEIAKAIERDNPDMPMAKKMAIATAAAKRVAEEVELDEDISKMSHSRLKWHMNTGVPHGSYSKAEMKAERDRRLKTGEGEAYKKAKPSMSEEVELDEISSAMKDRYISKASSDHQHANAVRKDAESRGDKDTAAEMRDRMKKRNKGMTRAFGEQTEIDEAKLDETKYTLNKKPKSFMTKIIKKNQPTKTETGERFAIINNKNEIEVYSEESDRLIRKVKMPSKESAIRRLESALYEPGEGTFRGKQMWHSNKEPGLRFSKVDKELEEAKTYFAIATKSARAKSGWKRVPDTRFDTEQSAINYGNKYHTDKSGAKMYKVVTFKEEVEQVDEISRDTARSYIRKASADNAEREKEVMKPFPMKQMGKNIEMHKKFKKREAGIKIAGKKAYGIGGKAKVNATESVELEEVLDRPGALDSYRKKAKTQSDKARNSATAKIVRGNSDISKEKETIRKREKGQDMADKTGNRQFRKSLGQPYIKKND